MACIMKLFYAILFVGLMSKGTLQFPEKVVVYQVATGKEVQDKPEWSVTVANESPCTMYNVKLSCAGFQAVEKVNPSILSISEDVCTIEYNYGHISSYSNISFTYAWEQSTPFKPLSNYIACS